jgi:hypothetical protein
MVSTEATFFAPSMTDGAMPVARRVKMTAFTHHLLAFGLQPSGQGHGAE